MVARNWESQKGARTYDNKSTREHYLNCEVLSPLHFRQQGITIRMPINQYIKYPGSAWNLRRLLKEHHGNPDTLEDLGITDTLMSDITQALTSIWSTARAQRLHSGDVAPPQLAELQMSVKPDAFAEWGPFRDHQMNMVWIAAAIDDSGEILRTDWQTLSDIDILEPDPKTRKIAMANPRLKPFWLGAEHKEITGLFRRGVFQRVHEKDLPRGTKVFGSRFHYKIKRHTDTMQVKQTKVRLVVQGQQMTEGEDYTDAFAPVPRTTAARLLMALAAGNNMHLHSIDISQAFVQASWDDLPEDIGDIYIRPPRGYPEEAGYVWKVVKPLYGIPSAARALNFTLSKWFSEYGFEKAGFEESVFIYEPGVTGTKYKSKILISTHIDDMLITCDNLEVLQQFKTDFLSTFEGTDEGEVHEYLGCEVVRDPQTGTISLNQKGYIRRILQIYGATDARPARTPLSGRRLTMKDCPANLDPALHKRYRGIVGHLSFLVQCTRPDLSFAYSELSKFVAYPGPRHLQEAEHVLRYLAGTATLGLEWSDPGAERRNTLYGWVDSDFAADPDTRRSVTGYILSLNNGPISWKARRQECVTLSSAEAEFVAASLCGQEALYIRALLRGFGFEQTHPTRVYEDNASCIAMSHNPVKPERSRHIDIKKYFLRDLVRDKVVKLFKCPGTENVADALTKNVPGPTLAKHRQWMLGTHIPFSCAAFIDYLSTFIWRRWIGHEGAHLPSSLNPLLQLEQQEAEQSLIPSRGRETALPYDPLPGSASRASRWKKHQ